MFKNVFWSRALGLILPLIAAPAAADVVYVGPTCQFATIQAAIDAVASPVGLIIAPGEFDEILNIQNKRVIFSGSYAPCAGGATGRTVLRASRSGPSVLTIKGSSDVTLDGLDITGADVSSDGHGGGIDFAGQGSLSLGDVQIYLNSAGYGGGINVTGNGPTEVSMSDNTYVTNNDAAHDGGGIHIEGQTHLTMLGGWLYGNRAGARGGGIQVVGPAKADLGSPGVFGIAAISNNNADEGGGVSVWAQGDGFPEVHLFSSAYDPQHPFRIENNFARTRGGGIFANAHISSTNPLDNGEYSEVDAWGVHIDDNSAPDGAALWLDDDQNFTNQMQAARFYFDKATLFGSIPNLVNGGFVADCPFDTPCNTIDGNRNQDGLGNPTDGSTVRATPSAQFFVDQIAMRANHGSHLLLTDFDDDGILNTSLTNCLLADNVMTDNLVIAHDMWLRNCTIAGNAIGGSYALSTDGNILVHRVILWQPDKIASRDGGDFLDVLTNDVQLVSKGTNIYTTNDPLFVDAAQGDYHLQATSPAVDFTTCCSGVDLDNRSRGVPLIYPATAFDIGAYELRVAPPCSERDKVFCNGFDQ